MNKQTLKLELMEMLLNTEEEWILKAVKKLLSSEIAETDIWDELPEDRKEALKIAREQIKSGKGIPNEEVIKTLRKKYSA